MSGGDGFDEPPHFTLRVSGRARHVRLLVTGEGELIVVVPRRFDRRAIPGIVESKRAWIERVRARADARRAAAAAAGAEQGCLPSRVVLAAVGEEWDVEYPTHDPAPAGVAASAGGRPAAARRETGVREEAEGRLLVCATGEDECRRALLDWVRRRAKDFLPRRLELVARRHGFVFTRVSVRHQRSRWASCSRRGTISLNLRLLFLEPAVMDYILLHELCHMREMNHSPRFWALVRTCDAECGLHRRQAREGWACLPAWLDHGTGGARL